MRQSWNNRIAVTVLLLTAGLLPADDSWMLYDDSQMAEVYITIDQQKLDWIYATENLQSDSLHYATFRFVNAWIDEMVDSIGFRIRGNTSRVSAKKSFKVSFNYFVSGREFHGVDKLNLNGEHNDPSIIRSKLCWDLFQDAGVTASRAAHARVYINGEYYGLYISVEHVDDEFLEKNFTDDSGNLWKCLWPADLAYLGADPDLYKLYSGDRPVYELKTNETENDFSALARLISVLEFTPDNQLADSLETLLDVPAALKYFALNILFGSWDDYRYLKNNYYLYNDPGSGKMHLIPYDYDNTLGVDWVGPDWANVDPYDFPRNDDGLRPLTTRLLNNAQYRNLFTHYLKFYNESVFKLSIWEDRIDTLKNRIYTAVEEDLYRTYDWGYTMDDFNNSYTADHYDDSHINNPHVEYGLKEFVNLRYNSLKTQLTWHTAPPLVYAIDWQPRQPGPADSITVTAAVSGALPISEVALYYQHDFCGFQEVYPMEFLPVAGTSLVEQADRWVGKLPPLGPGGNGCFSVQARDVNNLTDSSPRLAPIVLQASGSSTSGLVINEFMADNDNIHADEVGDYDDWIEIYNAGDQEVFLSGMYLTDNAGSLTKWRFPFGGVGLAAGGYLVIWADDEPTEGPLHATFKLGASGEYIALVDSDGVTVIDSLSFGEQTTDVAFGRYPDGGDDWQFMTPSPGAANSSLGVTDAILPRAFQVTAWPNPFNGRVSLALDLPRAGAVRLRIFDVRGRELQAFDWTSEFPQQKTITWEARGAAAGVYLYRAEFRSADVTTVRSGKLLYLK
ncbi:MAG: CotH kinase family protein [Candidatus Neomarinimicrobiota bacterium]